MSFWEAPSLPSSERSPASTGQIVRSGHVRDGRRDTAAVGRICGTGRGGPPRKGSYRNVSRPGRPFWR